MEEELEEEEAEGESVSGERTAVSGKHARASPLSVFPFPLTLLLQLLSEELRRQSLQPPRQPGELAGHQQHADQIKQ